MLHDIDLLMLPMQLSSVMAGGIYLEFNEIHMVLHLCVTHICTNKSTPKIKFKPASVFGAFKAHLLEKSFCIFFSFIIIVIKFVEYGFVIHFHP